MRTRRKGPDDVNALNIGRKSLQFVVWIRAGELFEDRNGGPAESDFHTSLANATNAKRRYTIQRNFHGITARHLVK